MYAAPRITEMIRRLKLSTGMALDLSVNDPDDDMPWDFTDPEKRRKALKQVMGERALLLVGSPMCKHFRCCRTSIVPRWIQKKWNKRSRKLWYTLVSV